MVIPYPGGDKDETSKWAHFGLKPQPVMSRLLIALVVVLLSAGGVQAGPQLMINYANGAILHAKDAAHHWPQASIAKVMTAHLAFGAIKKGHLSATTRILASPNAASQPLSKAGLKAGSYIQLEDALRLMLASSSNDLAVAIAEAVAGSQTAFVDLMNKEAKRIGMVDTNFVCPNGLHHPKQYFTAIDLVVLGAMPCFPTQSSSICLQANDEGGNC